MITMNHVEFRRAALRTATRSMLLHLIAAAVAASAGVTVSAGQVAGQSTATAQPIPRAVRQGIATRAELLSQATQADSISTSSENAQTRRRKLVEASMIRERLREGDFSIGDRIIVEVLGGEKPVYDSLTVRGGRIIYLADMPPISLQGILRSELEQFITTQVGTYVRNPQVTATALVQVIISGAARGGFVWLPTDILLSDAIMSSGGPATGAELLKTVVKRGNQELWPKEQVRQALREGMTLDQLNIRAGDEIVIGSAAQKRDLRQSVWLLSSVVTLFFTLKRLIP